MTQNKEGVTFINPDVENNLELFEYLYANLMAWETSRSKVIEIMNKINERCWKWEREWNSDRSSD